MQINPNNPLPNRDELVGLSEHLKRKLSSFVGRNRKGHFSAELRHELLVALDSLAQLATHWPNLGEQATTIDSDSSTEQTTSTTSPELDAQAISELVSEVVKHSVESFQTQITESVVRTLSTRTQAIDLQKLQTAIADLESELSDTRFQLQAANSQLAEYRAELKFYHEQTEAEPSIFDHDLSKSDGFSSDSATSSTSNNDQHFELLEQLEQQLESALNEMAELREQNSDLASQLAHRLASSLTADKQTGRGSCEQLSWEERKLLILKQLEEGTSDEIGDIPHQDKLSIQEVLDSTQAEITRRDQEIEELREIVRMQSEARDGVAIGAAGIAQMLDSDELLQQERQKLREIQEEWESKLRQAEIDLSMERAKIARERIAVEKEKEELQYSTASKVDCKEKSKERRWLSILGLGEGSTE